MGRQTGSTYMCKRCGKRGLYQEPPSCCKFCGSKDIERGFTEKSKKHAQELIDSTETIIQEMAKAWNVYADLWAKYEVDRRTLVEYARRGIIKKEDVPVLNKKTLVDMLYDYRAKRKDDANGDE